MTRPCYGWLPTARSNRMTSCGVREWTGGKGQPQSKVCWNHRRYRSSTRSSLRDVPLRLPRLAAQRCRSPLPRVFPRPRQRRTLRTGVVGSLVTQHPIPSPASPLILERAGTVEEKLLWEVADTPIRAFLLAPVSGLLTFIPILLVLSVIVRLVPEAHQRGPILLLSSVGVSICFASIGWFFGRKYPTTGWMLWATLISGPLGACGIYVNLAATARNEIVAFRLVEILGAILAVLVFLFLPTALGVRAGRRKTTKTG